MKTPPLHKPVIVGRKPSVPRLFLSLLLLFFPLFLSQLKAQVIGGTVVDGDSKTPLAFVNVTLRDEAGNILAGKVTENDGHFAFDREGEAHHLAFSYLGYADQQVPLSTMDALSMKSLSIALQSVADRLATVEVNAERTRVRQLIDRKVIEVGKDLQSAGGDAATLLEQLPEIQVSADGQILLRGSNNARILVDGKPSLLSTQDLLQQLPADAIAKVEIITAPSARQRASGVSGLINIITRRKASRGLQGKTSLTISHPLAYRVGTNLTLGTEQFNLTVGLNHQYHSLPSQDELRREGFAPFRRTGEVGFKGPATSFNAGVDWFPGENTEWSASMRYFDNRHDHPYRYLLTYDTISKEERNSLVGHVHKTLTANTNFRHYWNREAQHFLEIDLQFSDNDNDLNSQRLFGDAPISFQSTLENNRLFNLAADYTLPLGKSTVESGFLFTHRHIDSDFREGVTMEDRRTNGYVYDQPTLAAYGLWKNTYGPFRIQVGMRYEDYRADIQFDRTEEVAQLRFGSFFPSFHFLWQIREGQSLALGYNRRTARPSRYQINPFRLQPYPTDQWTGSPELRPEFAQNVEITYRGRGEKTEWGVVLFVRRRKDNMINLAERVDDQIVYRWVNLDRQTAFGTEWSYDYRASPKYRVNLSLNLGLESTPSLPEDYPFGRRRARYSNLNIRQNVKMLQKLKVDLNWRINFGSETFFRDNYFNQGLYLALRYPLLNDRLTLSLRGEDLLGTQRWQGRRIGPDFTLYYSGREQAPRIFFTADYQFSKGAKQRKRQRKTRRYN